MGEDGKGKEEKGGAGKGKRGSNRVGGKLPPDAGGWTPLDYSPRYYTH